MRICAYPGCQHHENQGPCRMHRIPASPRSSLQWMKACHWLGSPRKMPSATYLCSCHFNSGQGPTKENRYPDACQDNIPWIPVIEGRRGSLRGKNMAREKGSKRKVSSASIPVTPVTPQETSLDTMVESSSAITPVAVPTPEQSGPNAETDATNIIQFEADNVRPVMSSFMGSNGNPVDTLHCESGNASSGTKEVTFQVPASSGRSEKEECPPGASDLRSSQILFQPYLDLALPLLERTEESSESVQPDNDRRFHIRRPKRTRPNDGGGNDGNISSNKVDTNLQAELPFLSYEKCRHWPVQDFMHLTGISQASFEVLYALLGGDKVCSHLKYRYEQSTPIRMSNPIHPPEGHLFMTLVRLRRGFTVTSMRMFFLLDESSVSRVFTAWIKLMSLKFKSMEEALFVSVAAQAANTPDCYQPFPNLRCVVDAFEVNIQKPENMEQQSCTFSTYKKRNTVKFIVASSVYGGVSMISDGIEGSASDRNLFIKSGILDHLNAGEAVMADRGFDVEPELNEIGVDLIIPPFLGGRDAFTQRELMHQRSVAAARSHVETVIGRIKNFRLITYGYPNTMLDVLSDVVRVAANLVNFSDPFIRWDQRKGSWVVDAEN